jgi:hypothetical protein
MRKINLEELEEVHVEIDKAAFTPEKLHCSACGCPMKKTETDMTLDQNLYVKLHGFACKKCDKQFLGLEEAKKLDKFMLLNAAMKPGYKVKRKLSFDGDNYLFRVPKELTQGVKKKEIEIVPLGAKSFCAVVE